MEASSCEQGKSTLVFFSTTPAVFEPDWPARGVPGSSAVQEEPDDAGGEKFDNLGARAGRGGMVSPGSEDLGVSVCFLRIHVALRWL
jgi:hypothetical protein